ncbi:hypothetical protein ACQKOK_22405 [Bacillus cereus]|uniref:hypothetical protein n=1 Tax=Bacillus cereus TaxID=1396 RepID=UPI003D08CB98
MHKQFNDKENLDQVHHFADPFTWTWLGVTIAEGIISGIAAYTATEIIDSVLKKSGDYSNIFKSAIVEICTTIKQTIEEKFLQEYISDSEAVRRLLEDYGTHKNPKVLFEILPQTYNLVERFKSYEIIGFGGLILSCNLHLLTIKALSEVPDPEHEGFKVTLEETCKKYADMLEKSAEGYINIFKNNLKKDINCIPWSEACNAPYYMCPGQGGVTKVILFNRLTKENKPFPINELQSCRDEAQSIIDNLANEHEPYKNALTIIKGYREYKVT